MLSLEVLRSECVIFWWQDEDERLREAEGQKPISELSLLQRNILKPRDRDQNIKTFICLYVSLTLSVFLSLSPILSFCLSLPLSVCLSVINSFCISLRIKYKFNEKEMCEEEHTQTTHTHTLAWTVCVCVTQVRLHRRGGRKEGWMEESGRKPVRLQNTKKRQKDTHTRTHTQRDVYTGTNRLCNGRSLGFWEQGLLITYFLLTMRKGADQCPCCKVNWHHSANQIPFNCFHLEDRRHKSETEISQVMRKWVR